MAAFSVALYVALAGNLDIQGTGTEHADQVLAASQLARIRLVLATINIAGWVLGGVLSYLVAGRMLRPIEAAITRQRQFTAHASHELHTPLTVIKGEVDVTLARERSPAQYQETLSRIDAEVEHLETLVGDLLDLAQVEGSDHLRERERRIVGEIIREVVEPYEPRLQQRALRLTVEASPELEAKLDWLRVRHLLSNLIDNAIYHTPPRGEIRVAAAPHGRDFELSVFNSGSHLADDDLPHLFVPFYRGKESDPERGTGLGLALCDWVARVHGGSISAHNVRGGVSFVVRLSKD
jgi:signal transduction histidine kinase